MRLVLKPHPDYAPAAVKSIAVAVSRAGSASLSLDYLVTGELASILVPPTASPERIDGLWRHTCFEAFALWEDGGYAEYNFSPSGQWAAYRFAAYRKDMMPLDLAPPPIRLCSDEHGLELQTSIVVAARPMRLALSAVIEETNGRKSYWALAHPAAKPDFHHPDSFVHEL